MPRTRTRVLNRTRPHDPDYPPARVAHIRRKLRRKLAKHFGALRRAEAIAAQQKAPGLATGGSAGSADEAGD
ncbi:hypothetical protein [Caulobacter sp. LjRoot300]|uniref:hypothetical protein n=1 Tax=Caulobacter sp. LjRoot300 TaxID=3342321 RepID=UPI003ECF00E0